VTDAVRSPDGTLSTVTASFDSSTTATSAEITVTAASRPSKWAKGMEGVAES
jgi:hypothetical protein